MVKTKKKKKMKMKAVYIVRKHITNYTTGEEIRYEDYINQFESLYDAVLFLCEKQEKYRQTLRDYEDEGSIPEEGRRYQIVPIEVSV